MRLGIVGYRNYNDYNSFKEFVDSIISKTKVGTIVSGGHLSKGKIKPGTDTLAWKYALEHGIEIIEYEANWNKYGRSAGPIRNKLIVENVDLLIAFVSSDSVGTLNTIEMAQKLKIPIYIKNI